MGILYPDNQNRADRVKQLATNISSIQTAIKESLQDARFQDERTMKILEKIAHEAGYKSVEEYSDEALKKFTPEDREKYLEMVDALHGKDDDLDLAMKVSSAVAAASFFAGAGAVVATKLLKNGLLRMPLQAIATGLCKSLAGASKEGIELMKIGSNIVHTGLDVGEEITADVLKSLQVLKIAATVLTVVTVILDGVLLIYEAIEGAEQRTELQKGIKELCERRLTVKKLQQCVRAVSLFAADAKGAVDLEDTLRGLVKEGLLTEEQIKEKLQKKYDETGAQLTTEMNLITDKDVWKTLDDEDDQSGVAWKKEDPSLTAIQKRIDEELNAEGKA